MKQWNWKRLIIGGVVVLSALCLYASTQLRHPHPACSSDVDTYIRTQSLLAFVPLLSGVGLAIIALRTERVYLLVVGCVLGVFAIVFGCVALIPGWLMMLCM